ncbi:head-tail connector protein [Streptomyces sp. NPDC004959]|uniref:head-tail connector protein n=1 Tax=Streptomyces sp. NPDC004959 TaxID=3154673 RepID=UPI0033ACD95A
MAIGDNYLTRDELKAYMGLETNATDDEVDAAISSASREIERHCRRQSNDAETATARRYRPSDPYSLAVDDFWTADGFKLETDQGDGAWAEVPATEYELSPLNRMVNGLPWTYWRVDLVGSVSLSAGPVRVTARWGWESVPADIRQAMKMLASDTFQLRDSRMGVAGSDQFGTIVRVRANGLVEAKLKHYVRSKVLVA